MGVSESSFYVNVWILFIYSLKKLMFLYKLTGINDKCLKVCQCLRVYRRSSEFIIMCRMCSEFDIDVVLSKVMF